MKLQDLPTPLLLLDWPVAQRNIATAAKMVEGTGCKLRPHFKSHKCVPLAKAQLAAGNCCGMTAATVDEAWALVNGGVEDVLVANQIVVKHKVERLIQLARRATIRVPVDSLDNAKTLSSEAQRSQATLGILVEIRTGHLRWGLQTADEAVELAKQVAALPGLRFDGLQAYHGAGSHIADIEKRTEYARATMNFAIEVKRKIEAAGLACPIISGTGTGTFGMVLDMAGLTELQVGTYVLMDWSFQGRTGKLFEIALTVMATVISVSRDEFVLDVGMKGLGNRGGPPRLPALTGYEVIQMNAEEHTIVRLPGHTVKVGDRFQLQPGHANGTMNLYRQVVVHDGDNVLHIWPISATGYELPC